ncbi:MAG: hypothetical protein E2P01_03870 [Acidobacteria bacterium]|nr:MAG: hypothetical protein E2P01_03870 [Acidobacteriota bacterium]
MMNFRALLALPLLLATQPAGAGGESAAPAATSLTVVRSEAADPFKLVELDGSPPTFVAEFTQQMPTPGWTFRIDSVETHGDRIVARLTEIRPQGMVVQMIAPGTAKIPLGSLERGRYVLEIRSRRNPQADYRPAFATVLLAR